MTTKITPAKAIHSLVNCALILHFNKKIVTSEKVKIASSLKQFIIENNDEVDCKMSTKNDTVTVYNKIKNVTTWKITMSSNALVVETHDYSRWNAFLDYVTSIWTIALPLLPKKAIVELYLCVLDVFTASPPNKSGSKSFEFPIEKLINPSSEFISQKFIESYCTPAFSICVASFKFEGDNWAFRTNDIKIHVQNIKNALEFNFEHIQRLSMPPKQNLPASDVSTLKVLQNGATALHHFNKEALISLLTTEACDKIGLTGDKNAC